MSSTPVVVHSDAAPKAIGPYSQAVVAQGFVFCSGQIPLDPVSGELVPGGVEAQAERVLQNLEAVVRAAGTDLAHAVRATIFLQDLADFAAVNAVYARYFPTNPPARATVQVARLPRDVKVEIDLVAVLP